MAFDVFDPYPLDWLSNPWRGRLPRGLHEHEPMSTWIEEMGLHAEGFTDEEIAQIDLVRDDAMHVAATIQSIWPRLTRLAPVVVMVLERLNANQKAGQV